MKYKIGQKVKIKEVPSGFEQYFMVGEISKIIHIEIDCNGAKYGMSSTIPSTSRFFIFKEHQLSPLEKDWSDLEVGDELVDEYGDIRTILGICGRIIFTSMCNNPNKRGGEWTKEELIERGLKIKQPAPVEDIQEMTIEESEMSLNKLFGKKVKIIK